MMQCPDCKGGQTSAALVNGHIREVLCDRCRATGVVPDEMAQWIEDGQRLRELRKEPYRNLGTEAKRRGLGVVELSQMERGIIKPVFPEG